MKICYVCDEYPPAACGGIGTITQTLARALQQRNHSVRVIGTYRTDHHGEDDEQDAGVRVWRLRSRRGPGGWIRDRFRLFRQLSRWAKSREIDLIEIPDWAGVAAGWPPLPVPVVTRLHGSIGFFQTELAQPLDRVAWYIERGSLRRADSLCAVSHYAAERMSNLYGISAPIQVIYNPICTHTSARNDVTRDRSKVVFAGTLVEKKGIISLIRAWEKVAAAVPHAELHVFGRDGKSPGGGSMREYLATQVSRQAWQRVCFHGHQPRADVERALRTARLGVYPSYAESFGAAPLEAMACGCATIYSQRGPGPELIRDGRDALLVNPDSPQQIADAVIRVLTDDALALSLGENGASCIEQRFSQQVIMDRNIEFYESCLRGFRRLEPVPVAIRQSRDQSADAIPSGMPES